MKEDFLYTSCENVDFSGLHTCRRTCKNRSLKETKFASGVVQLNPYASHENNSTLSAVSNNFR